MKNMTNSAWAAVFIASACILACLCLFSKSPNAASVLTICTSIITGAFGYIQGKADSKNPANDLPPNSSLQQTTNIQTPAEVGASEVVVPKS